MDFNFQNINVGVSPGGQGDGDLVRNAFIKVNENFDLIKLQLEDFDPSDIQQQLDNLQEEIDNNNLDINDLLLQIGNINNQLSNMIPDDAPSDGKQYGRKDGQWTEVTGGGGGDFIFTEDIPVVLSNNKTLGKYVNGQTVPAIGKNPQEVLKDIAVEYLSPSFTSFGITQTTPIEVGTVITGNKNFTFAFQYPENIEDNSISIIDVTDSNTVIGSGLSKTSPVSANIGNINKTEVASHQWRATAINTLSNTIQSGLATVNWQFRYFRGAVSAIPSNGSDLRTTMLSNSIISNTNAFSFATGTTLKDFVIAIPSHKTLVEAKNMGTNENLPFVLSSTITTVPDAGGTNRAYKVYTLSNAVPFSTNYNINVTLS